MDEISPCSFNWNALPVNRPIICVSVNSVMVSVTPGKATFGSSQTLTQVPAPLR